MKFLCIKAKVLLKKDRLKIFASFPKREREKSEKKRERKQKKRQSMKINWNGHLFLTLASTTYSITRACFFFFLQATFSIFAAAAAVAQVQ